MSHPFKLFRLQQIDSQLDKANARLNEIENILSDNTLIVRSQNRVDDATKTQEISHKNLQVAERNVKAQQLKIEQSESTLYSGKVRNPKELQDLQNEVASLRRFKTILEDRQLEAMINSEEAEESLSVAQSELDKVIEEVRDRNSELTTEQNSLSQEVKRLEAEREAAVVTIEKNYLDQYERLRISRKGVAVAKVSDKNCSACGSTLSAALLQAARSPNAIKLCDTCGRILYSG